MTIRHPLSAEEIVRLERLGERLRAHRLAAGLTRTAMGLAADLNPQSVYRIEVGTRRTRKSTLRRIAAALDHEPERLVDELVRLAGPSLAPESAYAERVARRRGRRARRRQVPIDREAYRANRERLEARWAEDSARHAAFRGSMRALDVLFRVLQDFGEVPGRRRSNSPIQQQLPRFK